MKNMKNFAAQQGIALYIWLYVMKKLLVFVWLCVSVEHAVAQIRYQMGFSNKDWVDIPYMKPCNTKDSVEGDSVIMGYPCLRARTRWRGREWQAWYTLDIPCSEGPWKLRGLPGLILAAGTEGFSFQCISLLQPEELIYTYLYKPIKRCKSRNEYRRIEREAHEHPVFAFKAFTAQDAALWYLDASGKHTTLDDSFSMPYNPIELE